MLTVLGRLFGLIKKNRFVWWLVIIGCGVILALGLLRGFLDDSDSDIDPADAEEVITQQQIEVVAEVQRDIDETKQRNAELEAEIAELHNQIQQLEEKINENAQQRKQTHSFLDDALGIDDIDRILSDGERR
jgi:septal ring factor EnvC (AmiA/AmiB activator)